VALLSPGSSAPEVPDGTEVVITASGYEAAAELLAAPAAALVLDLGRITDAHRPLLTLAGAERPPAKPGRALTDDELKALLGDDS